ncbi:MAG: c-type cytochrome [Chloroflexota bacterium]
MNRAGGLITAALVVAIVAVVLFFVMRSGDENNGGTETELPASQADSTDDSRTAEDSTTGEPTTKDAEAETIEDASDEASTEEGSSAEDDAGVSTDVDNSQNNDSEAPSTEEESSTEPSVDAEEESNPFQLVGRIDPSITDGETLYIDNCARCHGLNGYGDGLSLGSLGTIIGSMNLAIVDAQTDDELFKTISNGKGVEMPPWGLLMTEEQRWALVTYVRTLSLSNQ